MLLVPLLAGISSVADAPAIAINFNKLEKFRRNEEPLPHKFLNTRPFLMEILHPILQSSCDSCTLQYAVNMRKIGLNFCFVKLERIAKSA
jgi:hypothetical protein